MHTHKSEDYKLYVVEYYLKEKYVKKSSNRTHKLKNYLPKVVKI